MAQPIQQKKRLILANNSGLTPCFTPVRSPQSNGMAEAFVKTFKRDYVYIHDRSDKGLRLKSPREFIREVAKAL